MRRCSGLVVNQHNCPHPATHDLDGYAGHDIVRLCDACFEVLRAYEDGRRSTAARRGEGPR